MDLISLYEKQHQDLERFKKLRDEVWQKILDENEKLATSFGGEEYLCEHAQKLYRDRINTFNAEWSMEGGSRYNQLLDQHDRQLRQAIGETKGNTEKQSNNPPINQRPDNTTKEKFRNQSRDMAQTSYPFDGHEKEKEDLRQKIAKQQAAIKARKFNKKKSR